MLSARSDLSAEMRETFADLPPAKVKAILEKTPIFPKSNASVAAARAAIGVAPPEQTGTDSEAAISAFGMSEDPRFARADAALGIKHKKTPLVEMVGTSLVLNPGTPAQARAVLDALNAGKDPLECQL
jgi:hypothetical protein